MARVPLQFHGYLITGLYNPLHVVGLRPKNPPALFVGSAQVSDAVRELPDDHIGIEEIGYSFEQTHRGHRLEILMGARTLDDVMVLGSFWLLYTA